MDDLRAALKARGAVGIAGLARNFRIVDTDKSKQLNGDEFIKCLRLCKIELAENDVSHIFQYLDQDGSGQIDYDEFLKAMRGPMPAARRKLVSSVFHALDARNRSSGQGRGDGQLSIDDIRDVYDGKAHPDVKAGKMAESGALTAMLNEFEGKGGNRDGIVTLAEWTRYYEDLSASIENDDQFALMMTGAWSQLFDERLAAAQGFEALKPPVPKAKIDYLEECLKKAVSSRSSGSSETRALEQVFKQFDTDGSKTVSFDEFLRAMERFGLALSGDVSGVTVETVHALFERYDTDGAGTLSYDEFVKGLFKEEAPIHVRAPKPPAPSVANTGTSLPLPSERGEGSRPPTASYARGQGGMMQGGMNLGLQKPPGAPAHGRPSGAVGGFNQSSGIFR